MREIAQHVRRLLTQQSAPDPLIEVIRLCGPELKHIAARLDVSEPMVSLWASRSRPLPAARRAQVEALAREAFLTALEETQVFFNERPELYRTDSAKRWRNRLRKARELLREAGVEVGP